MLILLKPIVPGAVKRRADAILQRGLVRPPLPADAQAYLADVYRDEVARLAKLIDRDLTAWGCA